MEKKHLTLRTVLIVSLIIGVFVVAVGYFTLHFRQRKALEASVKGTLPSMTESGEARQYGSDVEGDHYYWIKQSTGGYPEVVMVWSRLKYSDEGRRSYLGHRNQIGLFVHGMHDLRDRNTLYEIKCDGKEREFALLEVYEVGNDGRTLDYAKSGALKEWSTVPEDLTIGKLANIVCSEKKR
jgi:hypothetical protein